MEYFKLFGLIYPYRFGLGKKLSVLLWDPVIGEEMKLAVPFFVSGGVETCSLVSIQTTSVSFGG